MRQCCYIDGKDKQCEQPARFRVGQTDLDATFSCGDHVEDLRCDGDTVEPLPIHLGNSNA